uniref:RNA-directed DNA polymerase n=1 Tax=Strigamia maritima TaxID=126957 RepID=T1IKW5_STRMM
MTKASSAVLLFPQVGTVHTAPVTRQRSLNIRKNTSNMELYLLVVPNHMKKDILYEMHDSLSGAHMGVAKTWNRIKTRFIWPKIYQMLEIMYYHVKKAQKGVKAQAAPSCTALEAAKALLNKVILEEGSPKEILSDRGTEYRNQMIEEVSRLFKIKHKTTSGYHPRTNGLTERFNKTFANMLSNYYTPFFIQRCQEADLNVDLNLGLSGNQLTTRTIQYVKQARKLVNQNLEKMSEKSKRRFDKNRQQIDFFPGDLVYLRKPNRKVGLSEKLLPQYSGPLEIVMKTAPNNY